MTAKVLDHRYATQVPTLSLKAQAALDNCQAETGFNSYREYLNYHREEDPGLRRLFEDTEQPANDKYPVPCPGCLILSVCKNGQLSSGETLITRFRTDIIEALCDPPEDARIQVII